MELVERINKLRREKKAVILAHNYQLPEVQDIADYVGDSLGLSVQASRTDAEVIVFCGVHFMAETAKILSPGKTVLLPDKDSACPMADMINADQLRKLKAQHPRAKVMCYVNTSAEVKAECDICCTSSNAEKIALEAFAADEEVIFVPDKYLAHYVAAQTGRKFIVWKGFCPTHARILPEAILEQQRLHPAAKVIVHPENRPEVIALADRVLSTGGMSSYARDDEAREFIVGTEIGILHRMQKENPDKIFYRVSDLAICPNMKRTTLEKVLWSLEEMTFKIEVPPEIMARARSSITRMLEFQG
ncbi:MAG: quinolinate synthase NadA [Deltaproteobacteria bacterium]|nr:quinolinate synthase NadA [Deltaproteobacteria bacterium]